MLMELDNEVFDVLYGGELNTGEVENVCKNCIYHVFDYGCCCAHGWGYDDKGNGIAIACDKFEKSIDNSKN